MKQTFYSNGKLLITGEYVVLDGAKALALPTKYGQNLIVETNNSSIIEWKSFDSDGSIWFESEFNLEDILQKRKFEDNKIKTTLIEILYHSLLLNPNSLKTNTGYKISTELTFPKFWGLGTSSTLINNIAQWLQIDAFTLLKNSFGGSGYDIACAQNDTPIIYRLENNIPTITPIDFKPDFREKIFFVYLNQKQNSRTAIANYYNKQNNIQKVIPIINGIIKSLGAWGGDFVLAISKENPTTYFKEKGYNTIVPYKDMIL